LQGEVEAAGGKEIHLLDIKTVEQGEEQVVLLFAI
jgi:hypothetical protein